MNWYVLYTLSYKTEEITRYLNKTKDIEAFIPRYEFYYRKDKNYQIKAMFPGYIFVKTKWNQSEINLLLSKIRVEKNGMVKQLLNEEVSALRKEEIDMFEKLLDGNHIAGMSKAYIVDGRALVYEGPLQYFEDHINKVDKHNQLAYLNLSFMERRIRAGLKITEKI